MVEIAKAVCLEAIGDDCKQQVPRYMGGSLPLEDALPARA
jgi:hypothetical protein